MDAADTLRKQGFRPYRLAVTGDYNVVELMSYPYFGDGCVDILINLRTSPGNPSTVTTYKLACGDGTRQRLKLTIAVCDRDGRRFTAVTDNNSNLTCPKCQAVYQLKVVENKPIWTTAKKKLMLITVS